MNVWISGSSGLIGQALKTSLETDGHTVKPLSRSYGHLTDFSGADVVVHLAGESIAEGRWNVKKKGRIRESRVQGTRQLAERLSKSSIKPPVFICASAIGFYGDRGDEILDETSAAGTDFLSDVCKEWETAAQPAIEAGIRTVWIRTGIVLSTKGGALKKMLLPFKIGAGGVLGSGRQFMSWISLEDEVKAIRFCMDNDNLSGAINLVAPEPVTNIDFTKILGKALKRPTILPFPAFAARLVFGEMADALLLSSTRVHPKKLIEAGYAFCYNDLQSAFPKVLDS